MEAIAYQKFGTVGLIGCGDYKTIRGAGCFSGKKSKKSAKKSKKSAKKSEEPAKKSKKPAKKRIAVSVFVVSSADHQIISANVMKAEENDTDLLQQTSLCKKYWRMSLPWFTRRVAGKKVKVPGHFAFDDQADRYDDIARKCPHFLSSYGKLRGIARTISPHRRGLGIAINKWQKNSIEQTFCHVANRCRLFRQLPQEMLSFANIRRAVLTCLKLHNFINKEKHQKNVVESVAFAAALDVSKPRGQASIRRILRKQGMYKDASYAGTVEYEPIVKKRR